MFIGVAKEMPWTKKMKLAEYFITLITEQASKSQKL